MDKDLKEKWTEALRSGKYTQGKEVLKKETIKGDIQYCCLGVLAECYDPEFFKECSNPEKFIYIDERQRKYFIGKDGSSFCTLSNEIRKKLGLYNDDIDCLIDINDRYNRDFNYIADWIEKRI